MTVTAIDTLLKEHQASILRERRSSDRQPFVRPVKILSLRGETARQGFSRDISRNGISIVLSHPIQAGMIAILEVHSLHGDPAKVRAEARWCDTFGEGWYAIGWYFLESL